MRKEVTLVKGSRHTPEQIVCKLREADRLLAEGSDLDAVCRHLESDIAEVQSRAVSGAHVNERTPASTTARRKSLTFCPFPRS